MPILNYSTRIPVHKTCGEIQEKLAKAGALSIVWDYQNGSPVAIQFGVRVGDTFVSFKLLPEIEGVFLSIKNDKSIQKSYKTMQQAERVAWRILKDWVESQLAFIQARNANIVQVFLPFAIGNNGLTLYETMKAGNIAGLLKGGE